MLRVRQKGGRTNEGRLEGMFSTLRHNIQTEHTKVQPPLFLHFVYLFVATVTMLFTEEERKQI